MPRRSKGVQLYQRPPKRKGGQWRWIILDPDARPREISTGAFGDDRATAEKKLAEYLAQKHQPNFGGGHPTEVLIADVLSFYAEKKAEQGKRNDSIAAAVMNLGRFFDGKTVGDLTPVAIEEYKRWRVGLGDARGSNKWRSKAPTARTLKSTTARNDLIVLNAAQRFCWKNHKITFFVPIDRGPPSEPRVRFLTRSEAARLLVSALGWDQNGKRHRHRINYYLARLILIGLYTGTRKDRILRLQWVENLYGGWIDLDRGILHRKGKAEVETKKRAPSVPLADSPEANKLWAHLRRWRRMTTRYVIEFRGAPIHSVQLGFEAVCRRAGLNYDGQPEDDRVTVHCLRHTCVSWALAEGKSPKQVGDYVGMTAQMLERTYAHTNDDWQRATANVIGRRNNPSSVPQLSHKTPSKSLNKRERA
jgi:integrase